MYKPSLSPLKQLTCKSLPPSLLAKNGPDSQPVASPELCPACGAALFSEKCKVVCRSESCVYRIVLNCSEF